MCHPANILGMGWQSMHPRQAGILPSIGTDDATAAAMSVQVQHFTTRVGRVRHESDQTELCRQRLQSMVYFGGVGGPSKSNSIHHRYSLLIDIVQYLLPKWSSFNIYHHFWFGEVFGFLGVTKASLKDRFKDQRSKDLQSKDPNPKAIPLPLNSRGGVG
jgi:hypothetical protein